MIPKGRFALGMLFLLTIVSSATAFDGKRTGFYLGFGAGWGAITSPHDIGADQQNLNGIETTLDIGVGISDQLLVLYSGHSTIHPTNDLILMWNAPSVIVRYYANPTSRSFYVFGGPTVEILAVLTGEYGGVGFEGVGVSVGGGYQFGRHFQMEVGANLTDGGTTGDSFTALHATVNLALY